MTLTLTVCEKSPGGPPPEEYSIELKEERLTVRELIRNIVFQQVYMVNSAGRKWTAVVDSRKEQLMDEKPRPGQTIDWVPKYEQALTAFENNQVIVLLDGTQVEQLDAMVVVNPATKVTFLKLIPLVGG